jgi:hypothetical protein
MFDFGFGLTRTIIGEIKIIIQKSITRVKLILILKLFIHNLTEVVYLESQNRRVLYTLSISKPINT